MLSLTSVAGWEEAVLASIGAATGSIEERDRQIERSGLYGEYPAILHAYVELLADEESAPEALKRALFLVWRGAMEAPALTGIPPLPDGTTRTVIDAADAHVRRGGDDDELAWMLAWYAHASRPLFELYGATPMLLRYCDARSWDAWQRASIDQGEMGRRGQMGRYWAALVAGAT